MAVVQYACDGYVPTVAAPSLYTSQIMKYTEANSMLYCGFTCGAK